MRKGTSIGIVGAALAAAFGLVEFACDTSTGALVPGPTTSGLPTDGDGGGVDLADGSGGGGGSPDGGSPDSGGSRAGSFIACEAPTPVVIAGKDTGFVTCAEGVRHRASVVTCPNALPRSGGGECTGGFGLDGGPGSCTRDSDCTAKPYGTCGLGGGHFATCECSYGCVADSDCAAGEICECGDPVGRCLAATCLSDSACPKGSLCASAPTSWGGCSWDPLVPSYICQSPNDTCLTDKQCATSAPACAYDGDAGARQCRPGQLACPGRPFLVEGAARLAGSCRRADWSTGTAGPLRPHSELGPRERELLADHWTRTALMEHASVAAFARFALELLALGAPADLVAGAAAAMTDETKHARLAFTLASGYGGVEVGPGPLEVEGALAPISARSTFRTLVREGCIGETLAAVEATETLAHATDPDVRDTLQAIAADETRHAELSWRAARWLFDSGDADFRVWARAELTTAIAERRPARPSHASDVTATTGRGRLAEHGLLPDPVREELTESTLRELVGPCAEVLLDSRGVASMLNPSSAWRLGSCFAIGRLPAGNSRHTS
jgi:hypothetical protein